MGRTDDQPIGALAGVDRSDAWVPEGATASRDEGGKAVYAMGKRVTLGQHPPGAKPGQKPAAGKPQQQGKAAAAKGEAENQTGKVVGLLAVILVAAVILLKSMGGDKSEPLPTEAPGTATVAVPAAGGGGSGGLGGIGGGGGDLGE